MQPKLCCQNRIIVLERIEKEKVHATCGSCGTKLVKPLSDFEDKESLLHQFSQQVCKKCKRVVNCWSEGMLMPQLEEMEKCERNIYSICFEHESISIHFSISFGPDNPL